MLWYTTIILDKATVESFLSDKKVIKIDLQFTGDNAWLHILYIVYSIYCVLVGLIFNLSDTIVLIPRYVNSDNINNNSRDIFPSKLYKLKADTTEISLGLLDRKHLDLELTYLVELTRSRNFKGKGIKEIQKMPLMIYTVVEDL